MEIIKACEKDVQRVAPLFDAYRVFYRQASDMALATQFISDRLTNKESTLFLAVDEQGKALGFTQVYPTFSSVSAQTSLILNDLYVDPDLRGQGVGRALLNAAKAYAIEIGAKGLALETAIDNHKAQKLYESLGYVKETEYYSYFLPV